ncbi:craniofacial development protein 2 [Biomphalaria glabrata]|nr:craniofacial development protein 2-like [Biomphalaria glabrata]
MVKQSLAKKLLDIPVGHSDRLMSLRLPLDGSRNVTIISAYASTLPAEPKTKKRFYDDLRRVLCKVNTTDKLIIMGDCNARVGNDYSAWPGVLGKHDIGNCNDNGRLLLELCSDAKLAITNAIFQQKSRFKTTWIHPRSKHWHLLDYIIVRQWNVRDVTHTRVMPSADCYTDHRLVRTKLNITIKMVKKDGLPRAKMLDVERLADVRERFSVLLEADLRKPQYNDPASNWSQLKAILQDVMAKVVGYCIKDQGTKNWWLELSVNIQRQADTGDTSYFYESLRCAYGPTYQTTASLRSSDRSILFTSKADILNRWTEHYSMLFGDKRHVLEKSLANVPQKTIKEKLDDRPTSEEFETAISKLKKKTRHLALMDFPLKYLKWVVSS